MASYPNDQGNPAGAIPVYIASGGPISGYIPVVGSAVAVATGGTAVTVFTGPIDGGVIVNPYNAAAQGIATAENLYVSLVAAPGSTDAAANGGTTLLTPGSAFNVPALATGVTAKVNAATTGHKFTAFSW